MTNSRSYRDEIRFTVRRFSADHPFVKIEFAEGFLGEQADYVSVTVNSTSVETREAAREAFQGLGEHCHAEEYEALGKIDFTWLVE